MATIGNVVISVFASTEGLSKSLKNGHIKLQQFAKNAVSTLKNIGALVGAGGAAGIAAGIAIVESYAEKIDKLAKTSSKIGLSVGALQKLQYQAELTGVSTETLNMALQRMVRRVAEAAQGSGEAKNALKELGVDAKSLAALSPDEQFYKISDAMKHVAAQGDKVRLAMKLFDSEGVALVNTMSGNLSQMGDEFDQLGVKISQSQATMVESYNDSKTRLGAIFSSFGIQLTAQLAEPFTNLISFISDAIIKMGGLESVAKRFSVFMVDAAIAAVKGFNELYKIILKIENGMLNLEKLTLAPGILKDFLDSATKNDAGYVGPSTQKAFDIDAQIAKNNLKIDANPIVKQLEDLASSLRFSQGVEVKPMVDLTNAAKPLIDLTDATKTTTDNITKLSDAAKTASDSISSRTTSAAQAQRGGTANVIKFNDIASRFAANRVNPDISANPFSGSAGDLSSGNKVLSVQDYISRSATGSTLQTMFNRKNTVAEKSTTRITLNMVTDAGEVSGELLGNQKFIDAIARLQSKNTNKAARMAAN